MKERRSSRTRRVKIASTLVILALSSFIVHAATRLHFDSTVNVSQCAASSKKGRLARLAYVDNGEFVKPIWSFISMPREPRAVNSMSMHAALSMAA